MSYSYTTTETWSRAHARVVAGKVAADLRQMQQEYGNPTDAWIELYLQELTLLLAGGYVRDVTYGYRRDGVWVAALKYVADMNGNLTVDDRSGRVPRGADTNGASWGSYMSYSSKWDSLTPAQKATIQAERPFPRSGADEPNAPGGWSRDKTYSAAGCGLTRSTFGGSW
jgi:hypothetical protein